MIRLNSLLISIILAQLTIGLIVTNTIAATIPTNPITDEAEMILSDDANTSTPEGKIKQLVEERLKAITNSDASNSANTIATFGTYGTVDQVNLNSLTITNPHTSQNFQIKLDPQPTIINLIDRGNNKITSEYIGKSVIVVGHINSKDEVKPSKITLISQISPLDKTIIGGQIEKLDTTKFKITTINGNTVTINTTKKTIYKARNQKAEPAFDDLAIGDYVFFTAKKSNKANSFTALSILVKPNNNLTAVSETPIDSPTKFDKPSSCGDGVCQNTACLSLDCPDPETVDSCPEDCQTTNNSPLAF